MPHYDYLCKACGYEFEAFHAMSAESFIDCPKCHEPKLIKLIGMGLTPIIRNTKTPCHGGRQLGDRLGRGKNKSEKPFWRNGLIDKKILKNPDKYIKKGRVD
jgi:putative FmdB family regulatory protein